VELPVPLLSQKTSAFISSIFCNFLCLAFCAPKLICKRKPTEDFDTYFGKHRPNRGCGAPVPVPPAAPRCHGPSRQRVRSVLGAPGQAGQLRGSVLEGGLGLRAGGGMQPSSPYAQQVLSALFPAVWSRFCAQRPRLSWGICATESLSVAPPGQRPVHSLTLTTD